MNKALLELTKEEAELLLEALQSNRGATFNPKDEDEESNGKRLDYLATKLKICTEIAVD